MDGRLGFYCCPLCGKYANRPIGEEKIRRVRKCKGCGSVVTMDIPEKEGKAVEKETRFCPFKKEVTRTVRRGKEGELINGYYDKFKGCAGDRCMAYQGGECLRLQKGAGQ